MPLLILWDLHELLVLPDAHQDDLVSGNLTLSLIQVAVRFTDNYKSIWLLNLELYFCNGLEAVRQLSGHQSLLICRLNFLLLLFDLLIKVDLGVPQLLHGLFLVHLLTLIKLLS